MKIQSKDQILFYKNTDVIRFEKHGKESIMHLADNSCIGIDVTLDNIYTQLKNTEFIRVHSSHIVNVNFIAKIPENSTGLIELENGELIPVSKKTKDQIINILKSHIY